MLTPIEELVKKIAEYVVDNGYREISPIPVVPPFVVNVTELLDYISELTGIPKDQIGEWCGT